MGAKISRDGRGPNSPEATPKRSQVKRPMPPEPAVKLSSEPVVLQDSFGPANRPGDHVSWTNENEDKKKVWRLRIV